MPLHYNMKTIVAATPSKAYSRMHFSAAFLEILLLIIIITIIIINFFLVGARVWALGPNPSSLTASFSTWRLPHHVLYSTKHVDNGKLTVFGKSRKRWHSAVWLILTPGITCIPVSVVILVNEILQFGEASFVEHVHVSLHLFSIQLTVLRCQQVALLFPNISRCGTSSLCLVHVKSVGKDNLMCAHINQVCIARGVCYEKKPLYNRVWKARN